jgi:hypothetical protein
MRGSIEQRKSDILRLLREDYYGAENIVKARILLERIGLLDPNDPRSARGNTGSSGTTQPMFVAFAVAVREWRREGSAIGSQGGSKGGYWWLRNEEERAECIATLQSKVDQELETIAALRRVVL